MGATTFYAVGKGKNASEAFDNAYQEAKYEYGHGGYSGTVAEKPGFVCYNLPAGMTAEELFNALCSLSFEVMDDRPPEPLYKTATYTRTVTMKVTETATCRVPVDEPAPPEPNLEPRVRQYDTRNAVVTRALKWKKPTITPPSEWEVKAREVATKVTTIPNFRQMCEVFDDKWGSAVCVPAGDGQWAFMGYASC
jgi:hypothetical protein